GVLTLGPLSAPEADELVRRTAGGRPGPRLRASLGAAGGNPLHLTELLSVLAQQPGIRVVAGVAELMAPVTAVPAALAATTLRRVGSLTAQTQAVLPAAAMLGSQFSAATLAAVLGRDEAQLRPAIRACMEAGLLGGIADRLTFRLDVVRQALLDSL